MIPITPHPGDDPSFLAWAEGLIAGAVSLHAPPEVYCVRIDNWFGERWLAFAFNMWGAGFRSGKKLHVPPFTPARVVREHYFVRHETANAYREEIAPLRLHVRQHGPSNARRTLERVVPEAALFWISSRSRSNGRGSVMGYVPVGDGVAFWYVELARERDWQPVTCTHISEEELTALFEAGRAARSR